MKKLLEQALDALEGAHYVLRNSLRIEDAIEAIRAELAKPEPEPVAWLYVDCIGERYLCFTKPLELLDGDSITPLYK